MPSGARIPASSRHVDEIPAIAGPFDAVLQDTAGTIQVALKRNDLLKVTVYRNGEICAVARQERDYASKQNHCDAINACHILPSPTLCHCRGSLPDGTAVRKRSARRWPHQTRGSNRSGQSSVWFRAKRDDHVSASQTTAMC